MKFAAYSNPLIHGVTKKIHPYFADKEYPPEEEETELVTESEAEEKTEAEDETDTEETAESEGTTVNSENAEERI